MRLTRIGMCLHRSVLLTIILVFLSGAADAQSQLLHAPEDANVAVVLQFDKPTYFLGENVIGYYGIVNKGKTTITISTGGDYRGALRVPCASKCARSMRRGSWLTIHIHRRCVWVGWLNSSTIEPGKTFWLPISLPRYCHFTGRQCRR